MRRDRPSSTASLVAAVRALYTALPPPYRVAPDPLAAALLPWWLALPARAAAHLPAAAPALHRLAGVAALGMAHNVALRTRAIDDALREGLAQGAGQLVLLGAGLDNRAHRLDELAGARVFEVDHPSTHRYKIARLARVPGVTRAPVRVAIDFEKDRLTDVLPAAGFDPGAPSFWIWEGVTVYLTPEAIAGTLRAVGALSAPGSRLAVTYTRPGAHHRPALIEPLVPILGGLVGEPIRGMMETEDLTARLAGVGFSVLSDEDAATWMDRYWPAEARRDGGEWERLLVARRD
jgi:methyltransferase (TIGR00027 family)